MRKSIILLFLFIPLSLFSNIKGNITAICYQENEERNIWSEWIEYRGIFQFSDNKVEIVTNGGTYVYFPIKYQEILNNGDLNLHCSDQNLNVIRFRLKLYKGCLQVYIYVPELPTILYQVEI